MSRRRLFLLTLCVLPTLLNAPAVFARDLTFEERVMAQEAVERVYYLHQAGATKPFAEAVTRALLEKKVRTYLRESAALANLWNTPITGEMLRKELDRMAAGTRLPERLREIYAALGNDPTLIEECLARPALAGRLMRNFFAYDQSIHREAHRAADALGADLTAGRIDPWMDRPNRTVTRFVRVDDERDTARGRGSHGPAADRGLDADRLELSPAEFDLWSARVPQGTGTVGPVVEERDRFVVRVPLSKQSDDLQVATYTVEKRTWDDWWAQFGGDFDERLVTAVPGPRGPAPMPSASAVCTDDTWDNGSLDDTPTPRDRHTAVWTGSALLVWGGEDGGTRGGKYDPATDTWSPMSTVNAPSDRYYHTAVWTGSRMIVWGGLWNGALATGGRYDPIGDVWSPTDVVNAPGPRYQHTAVWTGTRMIVWGGWSDSSLLNTGASYDPSSNTWSYLSIASAPVARSGHTAIWTGSQMIVWGGQDASGVMNSGARYDPATDTWIPTSIVNAPLARASHTAVWTGSLMIVWGAAGSTGGRYDPILDTWSPTSTLSAPTPRGVHSAVWTGSQMVIWGGLNYSGPGSLGDGGRYDPVSDHWTSTAGLNAPSPRYFHTAIWTGSLMIVWGGLNTLPLNTGGRYDPGTNVWTPTSTAGAPSARNGHLGVWTGSLMVIWGGSDPNLLNTGGRYDPAIDSWSPTAVLKAPTGRSFATAVWTGDRMVIWGGKNTDNTGFVNTGGRYDPIADAWAPTSLGNAPQPRAAHTAVVAGGIMVVWGGYVIGPPNFNAVYLDTGGRYDPTTDTWANVATSGAPSPRKSLASVWTGSQVVVWGGGGAGDSPTIGGRYDPTGDTWSPTSPTNAPTGREYPTGIWTGSQAIFWGGDGLNTGGRYDPAADAWVPTSLVNAPGGRSGHVAVWSGQEMLIYGGAQIQSQTLIGGRYDPAADTWRSTTSIDAPPGSNGISGVWTGDRMVIWGGRSIDQTQSNYNTGGRYCACMAMTYYLDNDGDGFGDPGSAVQSCEIPAGYSLRAGDCNDADPGSWGTPSEVPSLVMTDASSISWSSPVFPGGSAPVYDLLRSDNPADFVSAATCVLSGGGVASANDPAVPTVGHFFAYLARARSGCPEGMGSLGTDSSGTPRIGRGCP